MPSIHQVFKFELSCHIAYHGFKPDTRMRGVASAKHEISQRKSVWVIAYDLHRPREDAAWHSLLCAAVLRSHS